MADDIEQRFYGRGAEVVMLRELADEMERLRQCLAQEEENRLYACEEPCGKCGPCGYANEVFGG